MDLKVSQIYTKALLLIIFTFLAFIVVSFFFVHRLYKVQQIEEKPAFFCGTVGPPKSQSEGKRVFKMNCMSCHLLQTDMAGPALGGIFEQIPSELWFDRFVTNEANLISAKDKYTLQINKESDYAFTHNFSYLDSTDLIHLKDYIFAYQEYIY